MSQPHPSNEEIIDSLTKDLKVSDLPSEIADSEVVAETNETGDDSLNEDHDDGNNVLPKKNNTDDANFIDETVLKERDEKLSDEEKSNLLKEALELKEEGNTLFKSGDYEKSVISYTNALRTCPLTYTKDRSVFFANRAASKQKLDENDKAVEDCTKAIELDSTYVRAYLRRAALYEKKDQLEDALEDYKKVIEVNPAHNTALSDKTRVERLINERNEKVKADLIDKMKDLGNMFLKPFGLSTNNFQVTPDPSGSGGYSMNFVQNK